MKPAGDLHERILFISEELLHTYAYDDVTLQMIADKLGITCGAITYHFKNKHYIVDTLIAQYYQMVKDYIDTFPELYLNVYWKNCATYILVHRVILGSPHNSALYYHKTQMKIWETHKLSKITQNYRDIAKDFHKCASERDYLFNAYIDIGARHRLYTEFVNANSAMTINDFCYYAVRLIGQLSNLDEATIEYNIEKAFDFANSHETPIAPMLEPAKYAPDLTYKDFN